MPKLIVTTNEGEKIGEVEVVSLSPRYATRRSQYGLDGFQFTNLWHEAQRQEELAAQRAEYDALLS